MTTKHRIPAGNVIIEDDQRIRQYDEAEKALPDTLEADRRKIFYSYDQEHKIIYVPVEPQPAILNEKYFHYGNIVSSLDALVSEYSPFNLNDTLILQEEWNHDPINMEGDGYYTKSQWIKCGKYQPASTMPDHLGQQFIIGQCLDIEEKETVYCHEIGLRGAVMSMQNQWHWKLLGKKKNET